MSFLSVMHEFVQSGLEQYSRSNSTGQGQSLALLFFVKSTLHLSGRSWLHEGTFNISHKKHLKPGAIPIIFPKSIDDGNHTSSSPPKRPASECRREVIHDILQYIYAEFKKKN